MIEGAFHKSNAHEEKLNRETLDRVETLEKAEKAPAPQ